MKHLALFRQQPEQTAGQAMTVHPQIRPGGRSERVAQAVLDAADELASEGAAVTVTALAARSGVSEVTIYRRWRTVENVMLEAAVSDVGRRLQVQPTGDLRGDLVRWGCAAERSIRTPRGRRLLSAVIQVTMNTYDRGDPISAQKYLGARARHLQQLIDAARPPADVTVEEVLDQVLAPLYLRQMFSYQPPCSVEQLVDLVLIGRQPQVAISNTSRLPAGDAAPDGHRTKS